MSLLWRSCRRTVRIPVKSLFSQAGAVQPVLDLPPTLMDVDSPWTRAPTTPCIEGFQGELPQISVSDARRLLSIATEHQSQDVSVQGIQENYSTLLTQQSSHTGAHLTGEDVHSTVLEGINSHVSLHGCMQSNVPQPHKPGLSPADSCLGYSSYHNMPGYSNKLQDKYVVGALQQCHPSRHFSTSSIDNTNVQGTQPNKLAYDFENLNSMEDPSPQGIQGDDCIRFKLWMENCQRYSLPNCDEQMHALRTGRKTLAEVFLEQQQIIEKVAEDWRMRNKRNSKLTQLNCQGVQDVSYNFEFSDLGDPCPQGLQGEDCANYQVWAHNCRAFGLGDCTEKVQSVRRAEKTLQDIFDEQDDLIRKIVKDFQQKRKYSTSTSSNSSEVRNSDSSPSNGTPSPDGTPSPNGNNLSQRDKLKRAIKEYGGTVVVFHVGISLISLGGFYLAVSSGLDVVGLLTKLGVGEAILQSRIAQGSTTFVIAYAVHKVFAPVRIGITLTCTPFLVRHLRKIGFLKPPKGAGTGASD